MKKKAFKPIVIEYTQQAREFDEAAKRKKEEDAQKIREAMRSITPSETFTEKEKREIAWKDYNNNCSIWFPTLMLLIATLYLLFQNTHPAIAVGMMMMTFASFLALNNDAMIAKRIIKGE